MQLSCDRLGFPLLPVRAAFDVSMLPVTKIQFERFLADVNSYSDDWYEQHILPLNGRHPWRKLAPSRRESMFITGLLPEEALAFARWLGPEYDLPTVHEWRVMYQYLNSMPYDRIVDLGTTHPVVRAVLGNKARHSAPQTWGEYTYLRGGIVEWVRDGSQFTGLGAPHSQFFQNLYNPELAVVRPHNTDRLHYFGFRLIRRREASEDIS